MKTTLTVIAATALLFTECKKDVFEQKTSSIREDNSIIKVAQPYDCSNLINGVTTLDQDILVTQNISYSNGSYAPDVACKKELTCDQYGKDTVVNGKGSLVYDVYYLDPAKFSYAQLPPAMVFFHAGGFSDCSNYGGAGLVTYCREFAKRGFIVFNVEYRRGRVADDRDDKNGNQPFSASHMLAFYRAFQDARGAIRSIISANGQAPKYKFDQNNIFVGGMSAGAYTALSLGYYQTQKMINRILPGVSGVLGPIDANYYTGSTSVSYTIKGVMDNWGGLIVPPKTSAAQFLSGNVNPPLIAFGGNKDALIPTNISDVYASIAPLNRDSLGLPYTFILNDTARIAIEYGVTAFYGVMKNTLHIPAELYIDCTMEHGLDKTTGFGTGVTNQDSVETYQVQRAATFFQAILNGKASSLGTTKFTDCENFRFGCDMRNNNNNCSNSDYCN